MDLKDTSCVFTTALQICKDISFTLDYELMNWKNLFLHAAEKSTQESFAARNKLKRCGVNLEETV